MTSSPGRWVWRKSSFSNGGNNACVEVGWAPGATAVRDSKNPGGGMLAVPESAWHAFRAKVAD